MSCVEGSMAGLSSKDRLFLSILLVGIALMVLVDSVNDIQAGGSWSHALVELAVVLALFGILIWLWVRKAQDMSEVIERASQREAELKKEALAWQAKVQSFRPGIRSAIDSQFETWSLTLAEKETALLILKGLSNKEIAEVRSASELTVKQQANAIYRKSGLSSRAQLIAFFLEDLF